MRPALAKLFERAKSDRMNRENWSAFVRKSEMLDRHGEALIAALEAILAADERGQGLPYAEAMQRAAKLLAQLEVEAHNG